MTDLDLTPEWGGVFRLEHTTPALAHNAANAGAPTFGANGPMNLGPRQLGNRTEWLRAKMQSTLIVVATSGGTYDLQASAEHVRTIRVAAGADYVGVTPSTLLVPAGEYVIVNECRWPMLVIGPSGEGVAVAARTAPDSRVAVVFNDGLDGSLVSSVASPLRDVNATSLAPGSIDSADTTDVVITGTGFLGVIDVQVDVSSVPFVVDSDTQITITVDGPAIGAVAGAVDVNILRTATELDLIPLTFT